MMILYLLLLLLFLILPVFLFLQYLFFVVPELPPGPNPWQVVEVLRTLSQFKDMPHVAFNNLAKIHGPLISLRFGGQLIVVASSSATAKEVLKTHDTILSGRYLPSSSYQIPGAPSSITMARECNETWKHLRAIGHHSIFSSKAVDSRVEIRQEKVGDMVEYLAGKVGEIVRLEDVVSATVSNIITSVLASRDLMDVRRSGEKGDKVRVLLDEIVEMGSTLGLSDLIPMLKRIDIGSKANGVALHRKMMGVWEDLIRERRCEPNGVVLTRDFMGFLVQNGFLDDHISIILTELLIAGTDTSIISIVWLLVELIRDPEILSKVRKEITEAVIEDGNFGTSMFDESVLSNCEYFQACIKETLRLHIPGPLLAPHRAIETCQINKYIIPKDSIILVNAWAIQQDPDHWKDASRFKPDRFLDSNIDFVGPDLEFLPFSAGRRMCPGYHLGFRNVQLVVASLIHNFDWNLPSGENPRNLDVADKFGTTLKREKPLLLIPRIRED